MLSYGWWFCLLVILSIAGDPAPALAHPEGLMATGWSAGFNHPLHGWDHLVVMIAVGLWAAQQTRHARWAIPLTFVATMAVGGVAGATGLGLPGVETAILLSVVVFAVLVVRRTRLSLAPSLAVVAAFAFFHGYAHGQELPAASSLATFGVGFIAATTLLHAMGYATACLAMTLGALKIARK